MSQPYEIVAFTCDGARYCPDCMSEDTTDPEIGYVFGDQEYEIIGDTCDTCGACYAETDSNRGPTWIHDAATACRWARCVACNGVRPYARDDSDARLRALRGDLACPNCLASAHF